MVKTGFYVRMEFTPILGDLWRRGRSNGYWKCGIRTEVKKWLDVNAGGTCGQHLWENEGQGDWLYTGMTQSKFSMDAKHTHVSHFWFRERRIAMLFRLTWADRL